MCVDSCGSCLVLALLQVAHDSFTMTQLLTVVNPELQHVHIRYQEQVTWLAGMLFKHVTKVRVLDILLYSIHCPQLSI